jgi:hypothetical protein
MENTEKRTYESPEIEVVGALVDHILGLSTGPQTDAAFPAHTPKTLETFS